MRFALYFLFRPHLDTYYTLCIYGKDMSENQDKTYETEYQKLLGSEDDFHDNTTFAEQMNIARANYGDETDNVYQNLGKLVHILTNVYQPEQLPKFLHFRRGQPKYGKHHCNGEDLDIKTEREQFEYFKGAIDRLYELTYRFTSAHDAFANPENRQQTFDFMQGYRKYSTEYKRINAFLEDDDNIEQNGKLSVVQKNRLRRFLQAVFKASTRNEY